MTAPHRPPPPPGPEPDALVARYLEAAELLAERPDAQLRAAVLAQAQLQAWKHADAASADDEPPHASLNELPLAIDRAAEWSGRAQAEGDFAAELPLPAGAAAEAANDRRWRVPAIASVAVLGLAALLSLQLQRSPESEQASEHGTPASAPQASPPPAALAEAPAPSHAETAAPASPEAAPQPGAEAQAQAHAPAQRPTRPAAERKAPARRAAAEPDTAARAAHESAPAAAEAAADATAARAAETGSAPPADAQPALSADIPRPLPPPPTPWSAAPERADAARSAPTLSPSQRLLAAAAQGRLADARQALAEGAPVESSDAGGRTALMLAAQRGNVELTRLLTGAGADPRRPDARGSDAAAYARRGGHEALARFLEQTQGGTP